MEDWKIKIAILWSVFEFGMVAVGIVGSAMPGYTVETPEMTLILAATLMIPPIMAFLSLTSKDSTSCWLNIIVGIVFMVLAPIGAIGVPTAYLATVILIGIVQYAALLLIVWYAWKSKQRV